MLSTKVDIIEEHHLVCSEEPVLAVSAVVAAAATAAVAAAVAAALSAAAAAEGGNGGVVRKAAVNDLTVCDLMPTDIFWPPKGLQGYVSHTSKEMYTIFSLSASASTYHKFCALQCLLVS